MIETTAAHLIDLRNELIAGGVPSDSADDIVRDAASRIIQAHGLYTKIPTDKR